MFSLMDIHESLIALGLSERESRVYQALLHTGPTTITSIISKTGIPSSKIYDILERLSQRGLVTYVLVKGKREFHAASPKKLFDIIKEKETIIEEALPNLEKIYEKTSEKVEAEIYKGKEGMKAIFEDIIKEGKDWVNIGASGKGEIILPYYMPHFYTKMSKKRMSLRILSIDTDVTRYQFEKFKNHKRIKVRYLPSSIHNSMSTFIYGNKVVIIPITASVEAMPLAIVIRSKESADSYRELFGWIWGKVR